MKIVVRMPNWIGDAVLALPALDTLRAAYPEAEIWAAARDWVKDIFPPGFVVNGIVQVPDVCDLRSLREATTRLKEHRFDIGLLLTNSFSSAFLFYATGIPERWGYSKDGRGFLLSRSVLPMKEGEDRHMVDYYLGLLSGLGFKAEASWVNLHLTEEERILGYKALAEAGCDLSRPIVILNPGASYGPAKRWPVERFADAARLFQSRKNAEIVIVGSANETEAAEAISSALARKPFPFTGRTSLRQLMGLISHGRLFLTNDSGPMHIANALKVPVVALFGPTDPKVSGPFLKPAVVLRKDVPCRPCAYRSCPYDHRCMTGIDPEEVFAAGQDFL